MSGSVKILPEQKHLFSSSTDPAVHELHVNRGWISWKHVKDFCKCSISWISLKRDIHLRRLSSALHVSMRSVKNLKHWNATDRPFKAKWCQIFTSNTHICELKAEERAAFSPELDRFRKNTKSRSHADVCAVVFLPDNDPEGWGHKGTGWVKGF